ncbi:succinylglutamate desuccinylase/aspartoacylase family protein [Bradyrhizobium brasilense]|uniref:succinylglutamate desuccinylase/aspartoacylase family protein n=1 Tax=Bradyrhizobium brasilense TaxID=1419277 RepID=UPI0028778666|nr:succinylglutamate desuccinylase/aspartoacylase family protein [Bradyrhizobium brasilense]MCP3417866.1 succinylglutamate desuccinylase/aspartoacylase family protein [Bradyrhizobium brasilense]
MQPSRIWSEIDFQKDGKATGYLRVPISTNASAYGWIPIPIASIKNGSGPRVLLIAGSHGDEWEGQIMLIKLIQSLKAEDIQGHLIILPGANAPAVQVGQRVSPLDDGNLNRSFPGDPNGTPTMMIAHFIEAVLLPGCDLVCDFHSGGSSLEYLPSTVVIAPRSDSQLRQSVDLLRVFGLPVGFATDASTGGDRSLTGACDRVGSVLCLSTELGGGGTASRNLLRAAEDGLARVLHHIGVLSAAPEGSHSGSTQLLYRVRPADFVYSPANGLFEPFVTLGDSVGDGQEAGCIHFTEEPWRKPVTIYFGMGGVVLCRRFLARATLGDCLFNVGRTWTPQ